MCLCWSTLDLNKWTFNPSIRVVHLILNTKDTLLSSLSTQNQTKASVSPKLNIFYTQSPQLYYYIKAGKGFHNNLGVGFQIQNLFNTEWTETQFATESRLLNEVEPVEEIHFTPGAPFYLKGYRV